MADHLLSLIVLLLLDFFAGLTPGGAHTRGDGRLGSATIKALTLGSPTINALTLAAARPRHGAREAQGQARAQVWAWDEGAGLHHCHLPGVLAGSWHPPAGSGLHRTRHTYRYRYRYSHREVGEMVSEHCGCYDWWPGSHTLVYAQCINHSGPHSLLQQHAL